jgi:hypothetical protein
MAPQANSSSPGAVLISATCTHILASIAFSSAAFYFKVFLGTRKTTVLEDFLLLAAFTSALLLVGQIIRVFLHGDHHSQQSSIALLAQVFITH